MSDVDLPTASAHPRQVKMPARVHFRCVDRRFRGTVQVLSNLDLDIQPGEFVSILGPSGCGKSTLLRLAAGLDKPDGGKVEIHSFGRAHFRGFVFQEAQLLPWRTAVENVSLPLELTDAKTHPPSNVAHEAAVTALAKVGLQDALLRYPAELSGGMKMRVSMARAMVTQPTLLLLDEPFAALDESTRFRLQEDLRSLWEAEAMTVFFVTHSVTEAVFLADRVVVLSPRPARVLLDDKIRLPSPRPDGIRMEPSFLDDVRRISGAMREQNGG